MSDGYLATLRNLYTGLQAETLLRYHNAGIINEVETEKYRLSLVNGKKNAIMLQISTIEDAFMKPSKIVECARWEVKEDDEKVTAICKGCKIINLCKKIGAPSPCNLYCLNPIEGMVKAIEPNADFRTLSTLWDADKCEIEIIK